MITVMLFFCRHIGYVTDVINNVASDNVWNIVCNKNNLVTCLLYKKSVIVDAYDINYGGLPIVKTLNKLGLDSSGNLNEFFFHQDKFITKKILDKIVDFNYAHYYGIVLCILNRDNEIHVTRDCVTIKIDDDGFFKKRVCNVKSANNLTNKKL
jgi:hypothetical protein